MLLLLLWRWVLLLSGQTLHIETTEGLVGGDLMFELLDLLLENIGQQVGSSSTSPFHQI